MKALSSAAEKQLSKVYQNIRKIRTMLGYSQQFVAQELEMSQKHYSQIENGQVDISLSTFYLIAEALNVTPITLLGFSDEKVFNNINHITNNEQVSQTQYNAVPLKEIQILYERMLEVKDQQINQQKELLNKLIVYNKK